MSSCTTRVTSTASWICTPKTPLQLMPDGTFTGRSAIHDRLAKELAAFSDIAHRFVSYVEQGDAFADEWVFVGTHTGPLMLPDGTELPPTGKRVEVKGMELVRIRGGKIVVDKPLLRQLGRRRPTRTPPARRSDNRVRGGGRCRREGSGFRPPCEQADRGDRRLAEAQGARIQHRVQASARFAGTRCSRSTPTPTRSRAPAAITT